MPLKIITETQILRCLSNTPIQIEVDLIQTETYHSKNTPEDHLLTFYKTFDDIRDQKYDGFIITGAPVETDAVRGSRILEGTDRDYGLD